MAKTIFVSRTEAASTKGLRVYIPKAIVEAHMLKAGKKVRVTMEEI